MVVVIDTHEVTIRPTVWEERFAPNNLMRVRGWKAACTCGETWDHRPHLDVLIEEAEAHERGWVPLCEGGYGPPPAEGGA